MQRRLLPEDIAIKAVAVFRAGERANDKAAQNALATFFHKVEGGLLPPAKARKFLDNTNGIASLIEEEKLIIAESENQIQEEHAKEEKMFRIRLEEKVDKQAEVIKAFEDKHTQSVATLAQNTDPVANNKSSFWINIRAGAIYFIAGLIVSPIGSILLKRPLDNFDKWFNGTDKAMIEQSAPPITQKTAPPPPPEKPKSKDAAAINSPQSQPETVMLQLGSSGLYDPATGRFPNLLDTNRTFSIIVKKPPSACQRPVPPVVCIPQPAQPR